MYKRLLLIAVIVLISAGVANAAGEKVLVCHNTSSDTNPWTMISVSENAVDAQLAIGESFLPVVQADGTYICELPDPDPDPVPE